MLRGPFDYNIADEKNRSKLLRKLELKYDFINIGVLSQSLLDRDIPYIQIGNPKNQVLLAGAFHGMEWLTSLLLLHFTKELCKSIVKKETISEIRIADFLNTRGVFILPCVNPDGVEISLHGLSAAGRFKSLVQEVSKGDTSNWNSNARGVDINHNFDAGWEFLHKREQDAGIIGPAKTRYGGKFPESELETQALTSICRFANIRSAFAFHSQGEEIYWDYGDYTPEKSELMARVMSASSGYKASRPEGLAVGGGFKDWFIKEFRRPAFTIEIGKGKNPLPIKDLESIYYTLEELLVLSIIM